MTTETVTVELGVFSEALGFRLNDPVYGLLTSGNTLEGGESWVTAADVFGVAITRGRERALDPIRAGSVSIQVRDESRALDPVNDLSTLAGALTPGRKVRVTVDGIVRMVGRVVDFRSTSSLGDFVEVEIEGTDQLGVIGASQIASWTPSGNEASGVRVASLLARSSVAFGAAHTEEAGSYTMGTATVSGSTLPAVDAVVRGESGLIRATRGGAVEMWAASHFDSLLAAEVGLSDALSSCWLPYGTEASSAASGAHSTGDHEWLVDFRVDAWDPNGSYLLLYNEGDFTVSMFVDQTAVPGVYTPYIWCDNNATAAPRVVGGAPPAELLAAINAGSRVRMRIRYDATDGTESSWTVDYALPGDLPEFDITEESWTLAGRFGYGAVKTLTGNSFSLVHFGLSGGRVAMRYYRAVKRSTIDGTVQVPAFDWLPERGQAVDRVSGTAVTPSSGAGIADDGCLTMVPYQSYDFSYGGDEFASEVDITPDGLAVQTATDGYAAGIYGGAKVLAYNVPLSTTAQGAELAAILQRHWGEPGFRFRSVTVQLAGLSQGRRDRMLALEVGSVVRVTRTRLPEGEPCQAVRTCIVEGMRESISPSGSHLLTLTLSELGGYMSSEFRAWTTYTPTVTNLTVGTGGTTVASYKKVGRIVFFKITTTLGTAPSASGQINYTLPFTAADTSYLVVGEVNDASPVAGYPLLFGRTTTNIYLNAESASGTYVSSTATSGSVPISWASGDTIVITGIYEAASA